jgi:ABC-2 type transport system permease protein
MGEGAGPEAARVLDKLIVGRTAIQTLLDNPVVHVLLWPIRAITTPAFATGTRAWLLAMPGALALLLLHYVWILRDPQPFEELAIGSSARFADRVARMRRGGSLAQAQPTRFRWELSLEGRPAVALAWKNVTAVIRTFRPRSLVITTLLVVIIAWFSTSGDNDPGSDNTLRSAFVTTLLSVLTGAVLTAPAWFRLDLRHDLTHLPFLKTAPIPAHTIVATEILTATAVTTTVMALLFGLPAFFLLRDVGGPLDNIGLAWTIVASIVALGGVNLLHITLYNAVALWLPAWVPLNAGGASTGGAAVVGQVYITLIGIILSLGLLLAIPAGAAYGLLRLLSPTSLPLPVTVGLMLAAALALVILEWLGLARLLGRALDRLEPSDIPAVQG